MSPSLDEIRYPIGRFQPDPAPTPATYKAWITQLAALPQNLRGALDGLTDPRLDTPYRVGAWTLRQIAHHIADEHLNAFQYFKMALTEEAPVIRKYIEPAWAGTSDARRAPPESSLVLVTGLHARWAYLLRSLTPDDFERVYVHPTRGRVSLTEGLQLYAWHGLHHTTQIINTRARAGW